MDDYTVAYVHILILKLQQIKTNDKTLRVSAKVRN